MAGANKGPKTKSRQTRQRLDEQTNRQAAKNRRLPPTPSFGFTSTR
jgi:hypothetical protein